jgi:hypothetical protein
MDSINSKKNFFQHLFNFDDQTKSELLNILQYAFLSFIPIILLNKSLQKYVPEADEKKGSLELSIEVLLQTIVMFLGVFLINRFVIYIPTYSGVDYPAFHIHVIILAVLMIVLSLQTRIGEKVSILSDRVSELWNGKPTKKGKGSGSSAANATRILPTSTGIASSGQIDQSSSSVTSIGNLPNAAELAMMNNTDQMYQKNNTPLVNANSPVEGMYDGPMPANSMIGSPFGSW